MDEAGDAVDSGAIRQLPQGEHMNRPVLLSLVAALLISLVGCGGGGSGSSNGALSKQQMLAILGRGVERGLAMSDAGASGPRRSQQPRVSADLVYDELLDLWVRHVEGDPENPEAPSGEKYFADEQGLVDGGYNYIWFSDPTSLPNVIRIEAKYLAGNLTGVEEAIRIESGQDESGSLTSHNVYPHEGMMDYTGSWDAAGLGQWQGRFTLNDGSWEQYTFVRDAEGGPDFTIESSSGITYAFHFAEDGSGTGTITGPGDLLPATIVWDTEGTGVVTWRDSTTSAIYVEPMQ
jgi:hypothetical protein